MESTLSAPISAPRNSARKIIPIVPHSVKGRYRNIKYLILGLAYSVYFLLPWLQWERNAQIGQALLFDLANSRFYIFGLVVFPQDLTILAGLMVFAAASLFIVSSMYGRLFCGYFCFQTIWTDAFRIIEKAILGEAPARLKLRNEKWTARKTAKMTAVHALWLLLSFATALTFTLYFADARTLIQQIFTGQAVYAAYAAILILTSTTYIAAGFAREDICLVACPYGKFQSVMNDPSTVNVIYDSSRGERELGRAAPSKAFKAEERAQQGVGDCIDCGYCVKVCPTGVDIRNGFQIGCIGCGLCVDACDNIMESMGLAKGLVRYDRAAAAAPAAPSTNMHVTHKVWPHIKKIGYFSVLIFSVVLTALAVKSIQPLAVNIQQQRQPLVITLSNGDVESRYDIRITNKTALAETYRLEIGGLPQNAASGCQQIRVPSGKTFSCTLNVTLKPELSKKINQFDIVIVPQATPAEKIVSPVTYVTAIKA